MEIGHGNFECCQSDCRNHPKSGSQKWRLFCPSWGSPSTRLNGVGCFGSLSGGTEDVTINGKTYTINWTVVSADLNEDATTEVSAKKVIVSVAGISDRSLTTILVDHENRVGKIS